MRELSRTTLIVLVCALFFTAACKSQGGTTPVKDAEEPGVLRNYIEAPLDQAEDAATAMEERWDELEDDEEEDY